MKPRSAWIIALTVLILDQSTKAWIQSTIPPWGQKTVIPGFFNLVHALNKGAAFGFLNNESTQWQPYFFITVSLLAVLCIAYILHFIPRKDTVFLTGLGLVLGGALGNLLDRIRSGMVLDFLDLHIKSLHWPAFNIADTAISAGALILLVSFYRRDKNVSSPG